MLGEWAGRARATPSGTWLVIVVLTVVVVSSIGQAVSQWDRVTESWSPGVGTLLGTMIPMAALAWGARWAVKAADRRRESVLRR